MSFVAYFSLRWEIHKLLVVLPLLLWSNRGPKKSTGIRNQRKDVYLRARPMPDDAPVMRAYPALSAALPLPVKEGREAEDNNFNRRCRHCRPSSSPMATGARQGRTERTHPAPSPCAPTPPPRAATPTSAFAVAIPLHCLSHHCGVIVVRLCCHHWFVEPSPETASVGELSKYSNVGIF